MNLPKNQISKKITQCKLTPTLNKMGYSFSNLTSYGESFLEFCETVDKPVLDIGAAYGFATIRALKKGAFVIANDTDSRHLQMIQEKASKEGLWNLKLIHSPFPYIDLENNSLSAILMSQVLHFLPHKETDIIATKMFSLLKPGGRAFITVATPYVSMFSSFIQVFEERKKKNLSHPGLIRNLAFYAGSRAKNMPKQMNLFDPSLLEKMMVSAGFRIKQCEFLPRPDFPFDMQMDGRENAGIIVEKPIQ